MIDLHSHVLPGLDDGPHDLDGSVALARLAAEGGTRTLVGTPHIRDDHPFQLPEIPDRAAELRAALSEAGIELEIETGGELDIAKAIDLSNEAISKVCLGSGPYLLVESPYTHASELLENMLFDLQTRGFRPILAHPERAPSFHSDLQRLREIVDRGVLCSVTAMSMTGGFGSTVRRFTAQLFAAGLVHNVASDAHDARRRPPGLSHAFEALEPELPGLAEQAEWFTMEAPRAVLVGDELPPAPVSPYLKRSGFRRLLRRG